MPLPSESLYGFSKGFADLTCDADSFILTPLLGVSTKV